MDGAKRQPSSLNQSTTARLYLGAPAAVPPSERCGGCPVRQPASGVKGCGDAVGAVVLSGRRLAVQVRSHQDEGRAGVPFDECEEIADPVRLGAEAVLRGEGGEPGTCLRVRRGGGLAVHAVAGCFADGREAAEVAEESRGVIGSCLAGAGGGWQGIGGQRMGGAGSCGSHGVCSSLLNRVDECWVDECWVAGVG